MTSCFDLDGDQNRRSGVFGYIAAPYAKYAKVHIFNTSSCVGFWRVLMYHFL